MSLSEIKRNLYKKNPEEKAFDLEKSKYDPKIEKAKIEESEKNVKDVWSEKKGLGQEEKKIFKKGFIFLFVVLFLIFSLVVGYSFRQSMFKNEKVIVSISGSSQARSGKLLTYEIIYENNNKVDINNAVLRISYPENFNPEGNENFKEESLTGGIFELGTIEKKSKGRIVFNGKAYSPKGALIYIKTDLSYSPASFSGQFEAKNQIAVNVMSAPLSLEIQGPQNLSSGDSLDYLVVYKNEGEENLDSLRIKVDYPEQFTFFRSDPQFSENNNIWHIGQLSPGQSGRIVISGKMEGERENIKIAKVYIGTMEGSEFVAFSESKVDTKIIASPLFVQQTINDKKDLNVNLGEFLEFKIAYRNAGNIGLRDVIITEKIDSLALDYSSLDMRQGGNFDFENKTITWKASDIVALKNLAPGQGGILNFNIKVRNILPISSSEDKNFTIRSIAKIDSPDIPTPISMNKIISSNEMNIKVNSRLVLDVKGYYNDSNIINSGPVPPKVGEETTYTMVWRVSNISNNVSDSKITTFLPTGAFMTGNIFPEDARLEHNERNNSLVWNIGNIDSGTGVLNYPLEVKFQVRIKPSPDEVGKKVNLLGESSISGKDLFTGETLVQKVGPKDTELIEDSFTLGKDKVVY